jgi:hypothetical protein
MLMVSLASNGQPIIFRSSIGVWLRHPGIFVVPRNPARAGAPGDAHGLSREKFRLAVASYISVT